HGKYGGRMTLGYRDIELPPDAIVSVTRGERFSLWRLLINSIANQLVLKQLQKNPHLLYAELTGGLDEMGGQTVTVWRAKEMVPFRDSGAHGWALKYLKWVIFGGRVEAYFLTWKANGRIPTTEEARTLVKAHGRGVRGGKPFQQASRFQWGPDPSLRTGSGSE
ncbi:MAG: hypothetical protein L0Y66_12000, partial [Myxococcaceae bacterium]|nr:hypothetical protein [Myxococcaceae bacterium]